MAQKVQEIGKLKKQIDQLKKEHSIAIRDTKIWEMLFKSLQDKYEGTNIMMPDKEMLQIIKKNQNLKLDMQHLERDRNDARKDTLIWEKLFKSLEGTCEGTSMMIPNEQMLTVMKELEKVKMELRNLQSGVPMKKSRKSFDDSTRKSFDDSTRKSFDDSTRKSFDDSIPLANLKSLMKDDKGSPNTDKIFLKLEEALFKKESENIKLRASLAKQRESCKKTRDLYKKALHEKNITLDIARTEINKERENNKKKLAELQADINNLNKKIADLKSSDRKVASSSAAENESRLLAEIQNLKRQLDSCTDLLSAPEIELFSNKEDLNSAINGNLRRSSRRLSGKGQTLDSCVETLTLLNNNLESEVKDLRKRVDEYDTSISDLVTQHSKDIDSMSRQNIALTEANEMLREVYVGQQKENDALKEQMEVLQKEIETMREKNTVLQTENDASSNQIDSLNKDNDNLKSEKNTLINENTKLQETIADMEDAKKTLDEYNDFLQKDYDSLKAMNDVLNINNKTLENEKVGLEDENKHLKEQIVEKEEKNKSLEELSFNLELKITALEHVQNDDNLSDAATVILDAESVGNENKDIDHKDIVLEQDFVHNSNSSLLDQDITTQVDKNNTSDEHTLDLERSDNDLEHRNRSVSKRKLTESSVIEVNASSEDVDLLAKRAKNEDGPNTSTSNETCDVIAADEVTLTGDGVILTSDE